MITLRLSIISVAVFAVLHANSGQCFVLNDDELEFYFGPAKSRGSVEYEIIELPVELWQPDKNGVIEWKFTGFGEEVNLELKRNDRISVTSFVDVFGENGDELNNTCHYIHVDATCVVALSNCVAYKINAFLLFENVTLEIHPLLNRIKKPENRKYPYHPHLLKKVGFTPKMIRQQQHSIKRRETVAAKPTIEVAFFVDETYYDRYAPILDNDRKEVRGMLIAYLSAVQAIFHHPSLETTIDMIITQIYKIPKKGKFFKMKSKGDKPPSLLESFCDFQQMIGYKNDENPLFWDVAVLLTGVDLSNLTDDSYNVGGQAYTDTICSNLACAIVNFDLHAPYVIAHEIGHVLGMDHDNSPKCPDSQFVMSAVRNPVTTNWSPCSADIANGLTNRTCLYDTNKPENITLYPGEIYDANRQCQIYLNDKKAKDMSARSTCLTLWCMIPPNMDAMTFEIKLHSAGIPLDGTACPDGKICLTGICSPKP